MADNLKDLVDALEAHQSLKKQYSKFGEITMSNQEFEEAHLAALSKGEMALNKYYAKRK